MKIVVYGKESAMRLVVNGSTEITDAKTVKELLSQLGWEGSFFAVAVNRTCIPRKDYETTLLCDNDEVEILTPQSGG